MENPGQFWVEINMLTPHTDQLLKVAAALIDRRELHGSAMRQLIAEPDRVPPLNPA